MRKVIYAKYNQTRNPRFATKTLIVSDNGKRWIEKSAIGDSAKEHIDSFPEKYAMSKRLFPRLEFLPSEVKQGSIRYDFVKGTSLDESIKDYIHQPKVLAEKIDSLYRTYCVMDPAAECAFEATKEYRELFGDVDCTGEPCIRPVNLDVIFDNIVINGNQAIAFDYEWTFNVTVPKEYVYYRVVAHIYDKYRDELSAKIGYNDFLRICHIREEKIGLYKRLETAFIHTIYSGGDEALTTAVLPRRSPEDILAAVEKKWEARLNNEKALVRNKEAVIANKEEVIANKEEVIANKEAVIGHKEIVIHEKDREIDLLRSWNSEITGSVTWKLTAPLRKIEKACRMLKNEGVAYTFRKVANKFNKPKPIVVVPPEPTPEEQDEQVKHEFKHPVKISVITPLFKTEVPFLRAMIESVQVQTYENWELCLVDFSPAEVTSVEETVKEYTQNDGRIHYERDENINIPENTNRCIRTATGEYIAILDHDDVLHPSALYEAMCAIDEDADFIYTDEVKFEGDIKNLKIPYFKQDFSKEELRVHNYICHFNVYKKSLLDEAGYYDFAYNGSQDHDIVLRLTEKAKKIVHIPQLLYYWRVSETSVAENIGAKPYATLSGIAAINASYEREGIPYQVESVRDNIPVYKIITPVHKEKYHVVLWGCDNKADVEKTLSSIEFFYTDAIRISFVNKPGFSQYIGTDMEGLHPEYEQMGEELSDALVTQILNGIEEEYCLFIKAGLEFISENPLHTLLNYATLPGVAASDAWIRFKSWQTMSAGVAAQKDFDPQVILRGNRQEKEYEGYELDYIHARNVIAVTGLCTMIAKKEWLAIPAPVSKEVNPFIARSLHAHEAGIRLIWDANVSMYGDLENYNAIVLAESFAGDVPEREPYFSEHIIKNHFE